MGFLICTKRLTVNYQEEVVMLKVRKPIMATDQDGNEVLVASDYQISSISDNGPIEGYTAYDAHGRKSIVGWSVAFRITNLHWTEIVTCDAVEFLKALEG